MLFTGFNWKESNDNNDINERRNVDWKKNPSPRWDLNPGPSVIYSDALTTEPQIAGEEGGGGVQIASRGRGFNGCSML